ncbi:MAG: sulfatase [Acidobacteriota bacterium]
MLALGCGREPAQTIAPPHTLIDAATQRVALTPTAAFGPPATWSFALASTPPAAGPMIDRRGPDADLSDIAWHPADGERFDWRPDDDGRGWRLDLDQRQVRLVLPARFDAEALGALDIELAEHASVHVRLSWRRADGRFADGPSMRVRASAARGPQRTRYRFDLRHHPDWNGTIHGLRVRFIKAPETPLRLRAVRGLRHAADWTADAAAREVWRVDLPAADDRIDAIDRRSALVTPPTRPVVRTVVVPRRPQLWVDFGVLGTCDGPVVFTVDVAPVDQPADARRLLRARLGPDDPAGWWNAALDLGMYVHLEVTLTFAARGDRPLDPRRTLPVWSHPTLMSLARDRNQLVAAQPNLVLISIDTLRADRLGLAGHDRDTSPKLDRWAARRAVTFTEAIVQAPWTLPSHATLFSGLDAVEHGVNHPDAVAQPSMPLVADALRRAGYHTAAVTGGAWLHPRYGLDRGFDHYSYRVDPAWTQGGLDADVARLRTHLDALPEPFFLFWHTFEVHDFSVRRAPNGRRMEDPRSGPPRDGDAYDRAVRAVDDALGAVLDALEASGRADRTAVLITSDHGEALGENGIRGHGHLLENNLRVPLLLALPGGRDAGRTIDVPVQSLDVAPTLRALAGLDPDPPVRQRIPHPLGPRGGGRDLVTLLAADAAAPARPALTYVTLPTQRLSLRNAGRGRYQVRSGVLPFGDESIEAFTGAPIETWVDLRRPAPDLRAPEPFADDDPRRDVLRRAIAPALDAVPGLTLDVRAGDAALTVEIAGALVRPDAVKRVALPGPTVAPGDTGRELRLRVAPGAQDRLRFERVAAGAFDLTVRAGDAPATTRAIDPAAAQLPRCYRVDRDGGWRDANDDGREDEESRAGDGDRDARICLRWRATPWQTAPGAPLAEATAPYDDDPELRERLRALGYLD